MWVLMLASENISKGQTPLFYERDDDFRDLIWRLVRQQQDAGETHEASLGRSVSSSRSSTSISDRMPLRQELDKVWYMFSHLILSNYNLCNEGYEAITTVKCENGFKVLIKRPFSGVVLFAAISVEDAGCSVPQIQRRMDTLLTVLTFLYGPAYDYCLNLGMGNLNKKRHDWNEISLLINRWHWIAENEQCYLVEAIEEISNIDTAVANQRTATFDAKCDAILKDARVYIKSKLGFSYDFVIHTMLVVENKLIKCTSSEKDRVLSSYDQLMMMIFSMAYFPSNLAPEDLFAKTYSKKDEENIKAILREDSSEDLLSEVDSDVVPGTNRYYRSAELPVPDEESNTEPDTQSLWSARSEDSSGKKSVMFTIGSDIDTANISNVDTATSESDTEKLLPTSLNNVRKETAITSMGHNQQMTYSTAQDIEDNCKTGDLKASELVNGSKAIDQTNKQQNPAIIHTIGSVKQSESDPDAVTGEETSGNISVSRQPMKDGVDDQADFKRNHFRNSYGGSSDTIDGFSSITSRETIVAYPCVDTDSSMLRDGSLLSAKDCQSHQRQDDNVNSTEIEGNTHENHVRENQPMNGDSAVSDSNLHSGTAVQKSNEFTSNDKDQNSTNTETTQVIEFNNSDTPPLRRARSVTDSVTEAEHNNADNHSEAGDTAGDMERIPSPYQSDQSSTHTNVSSLTNSAVYQSAEHRTLIRHAPGRQSLPSGSRTSMSLPKVNSFSHANGRLGDKRGLPRGGSVDNLSSSKPTRGSYRQRHVSHRDGKLSGQESDGGRSAGEDRPFLSPMTRRPSGDSDASFHSTASFVPLGRSRIGEPLLDTIKLLEDVHHYTSESERRYAEEVRRNKSKPDQQMPSPPSKDLVRDLYVHKRVFVKSPLCDYVPACLYVVAVSKGVNLVIAAETSEPQSPNKIIDVLNQLNFLLVYPRGPTYAFPPPDQLVNRMLEKLKEITEQLQLRSQKKTHLDLCESILKRWQKDLPEMKSAFKRRSTTSLTRIPDKLENTIVKVIDQVKRIFYILFMAVNPLKEESRDVIAKLQLRTSHKLRFYKGILLVKSNRNMPISAFQNDRYPGLVHFLYIYRNKNVMKSPSIVLSRDDKSTTAQVTRDMKVRMWRILPWIYKQLSNGYTSISVKDGDFIFTFAILIYDEVHYRFFPKLLTNRNLYTDPPLSAIGDLSGGFYKRLLKIPDIGAGLKLLELLTVHFAVTPRETIENQRKQLLENELHKRHEPFAVTY